MKPAEIVKVLDAHMVTLQSTQGDGNRWCIVCRSCGVIARSPDPIPPIKTEQMHQAKKLAVILRREAKLGVGAALTSVG